MNLSVLNGVPIQEVQGCIYVILNSALLKTQRKGLLCIKYPTDIREDGV